MGFESLPPIWNFEQEPASESMDETSYNLRAYFDRMDDVKLAEFCAAWPDEQVMEWDGNFKADGYLLLPCSDREVDVAEYRRVAQQCIDYRRRIRAELIHRL
jgi:hypothetical protein